MTERSLSASIHIMHTDTVVPTRPECLDYRGQGRCCGSVTPHRRGNQTSCTTENVDQCLPDSPLQHHLFHSTPAVQLKGWYFFQQYMARGNTSIPAGSDRQLREDSKPLLEWFLSMTTPDEKKVLWPAWNPASKRLCVSSFRCAWMCWCEPDSSCANFLLASPVLHCSCLAAGWAGTHRRTTVSVPAL